MCEQHLPQSARYCLSCGASVVTDQERLVLVRLSEEGPKQVAPLDDGALQIGKGEQCQIRLHNDDYVSRLHAVIKRAGEQLVVEDLGSSNGTYVRLRRPCVLEAGDVIVIGTTAFRVDPAV
ncbi:MAG: FHA domain-containing protein [Phycisphaerae bacterium]|nr:FHA domain-containing protein [Phycisphaerae bacterium]